MGRRLKGGQKIERAVAFSRNLSWVRALAVRSVPTQLASSALQRILVVGDCSVDDGVTAWAWLLNEGCDTTTTSFVGTATGSVLAFDVLAETRKRGLALPEGGVWTFS